jgi:copper transport protein
MRRRSQLLLLTSALWFLAGVASAPPAAAHASLVASTPSDLQILDTAPSELVLAFDEDVVPALSTLRVTGPGTFVSTLGRLTRQGGSGSTLVAALRGGLPAGDHTVEWHTVSVDDGHPTWGSFSFRTLGATAAPAAVAKPAQREPGRTPAATALAFGIGRWLAFLGLAGAVGAALLLTGTGGGGARPLLGALATWSCVVLGAGTLQTLPSNGG